MRWHNGQLQEMQKSEIGDERLLLTERSSRLDFPPFESMYGIVI
jgi:hypothetical protein